jgi:hypothetical protein
LARLCECTDDLIEGGNLFAQRSPDHQYGRNDRLQIRPLNEASFDTAIKSHSADTTQQYAEGLQNASDIVR